VIARAQAAHSHLQHVAKARRFTERLPLQQITRVSEVPRGLIVIASMQSHWISSSIGCRFFAMPSSVTWRGYRLHANIWRVCSVLRRRCT
jgi:hypothetical protein